MCRLNRPKNKGPLIAAVELQRLLFRGDAMTAAERAHLRDALLRYCAVDTMSMVRLLERLRELT